MKKFLSLLISLFCYINVVLLFNNICIAEEIEKDSFIQIKAGESHCIALKSDGTVWAWGRGLEGQLGNGKFENSTIPVKVDKLQNITSLAAGGKHNLAIDTEGGVWTWGYNNHGQLGIGSHANKATPVKIDYSKCSPYTLAIGVMAGYEHSLILTEDTILSFGSNEKGQLGDREVVNEKQRVGNVKKFSYRDEKNIYYVSAAGNRSYAGTLCITGDYEKTMNFYAWGEDIAIEPEIISANNKYGENDFIAGSNSYAITYENGFVYYKNGEEKNYNINNIKSIVLEDDYGLVLNKSGEVYIFGKSIYGDKKINNELKKINELKNIEYMAGGKDFAIFEDKEGNVWGIGSNESGQLGNGTTKRSDIPIQTKSTNFSMMDTVSKISVGANHILMIKKDGTVWALGENESGQLGNGNKEKSLIYPVQVIGLTDVEEISAGNGFSIAVKKDGTVWSWGRNDRGQLGNGTKTYSNIPVQVQMTSLGKTVSAGDNHVLLVDTNEIAWSWGANTNGQLGDKSYLDRNVPVQISLTCVKKVSAGNEISILLKNNGDVYTFGDNSAGQLGGARRYNNKPVQIDLEAKDISAGDKEIIVLKYDGTVYTCGYNHEKALGIEMEEEYITTLTQIPYLNNVEKISAGLLSSYALTADKKVLFWGAETSLFNNKGKAYAEGSRVRVFDFDGIKDISVFGEEENCFMLLEEDTIKKIDGKEIEINAERQYPKYGNGTEENPYLIYNAEDFNKIRYNLELSYKVMEDIDFEGEIVDSIGSAENPFKGIFDGNGHSFLNLKIENGKEITKGNIFAYTEGALIKNLNLARINISCTEKIGALVGKMIGGSISDCSVYTIKQNVPENINKESIFVYTSEGNIKLSGLDFGNIKTLKGFNKTLNIKKDNNYNLELTSDNTQYVKAIVYRINYDKDKIKITSLSSGKEVKKDKGTIVDKDIDVISNTNGELKFRVNRTDKNWSGILANLNFTGISDGETTISFSAE